MMFIVKNIRQWNTYYAVFIDHCQSELQQVIF